jgi:hypothetical protein
LKKEESDIEEHLNYYKNEMVELEYNYKNEIVKLQNEIQNYNRELEDGDLKGNEYHYVRFYLQSLIERKDKETEKYKSQYQELIRLHNETMNDKNNLYALKGKLLDLTKVIGNDLEKFEKRSDFEDALLYLSMLSKRTKKTALNRTAKNRSYKNNKINGKIFDENEKDVRKRRLNMLKNRVLKRENEEKQKKTEKLKKEINLNDISKEMILSDDKTISITGNKNHNKTLKNTFRRIKLII